MHRLTSLCTEYFGNSDLTISPITGSGSNRQYFRISRPDGKSLIGVVGTSKEENIAFLHISEALAAAQIPVPQIYAVSADSMCYIQQDLGSTALFDTLSPARQNGQYSNHDIDLLKKTMTLLADIQFAGGKNIDYSRCYPQPEFDRRMISFDLNYFKYCFLKTSALDFQEIALDDDFNRLADDLLAGTTDTFMYRDFQARNVMIYNDTTYFIDYQGGRRGPIYYDVASFLWQAKAAYPDALRQALIDTYIESARKYTDIDRAEFIDRLRLFVLFRTLQVLGAYGFRGEYERKEHFIRSVPFAIDNLRTLIDTPFANYPYLQSLLTQLTAIPRYQHKKTERLTVDVYSFSYKKGLPADTSDNGGGYIFDCRGMHNPGRYDRYKQLTGRDQEVIDFLEQRREVFTFLDAAYSLVDHHTECFIRRGFAHLLVAFGCTGGQHRSVYCAEHMAHHLRQKYDINVNLIHREMNEK